jgi:hypothetical protein
LDVHRNNTKLIVCNKVIQSVEQGSGLVLQKRDSDSRKTVLKTMRIPNYINSLLEKDADSKGVSVNALISMIMTKYAEWDRYVERFGSITIKLQAFREMLEEIDEVKLADIASRSGSRFPKEFVLFRFKRANLDTYLEALKLMCKYKGYARYELESDESGYTVILVHDLGEKWSNFLRHVVEGGMRSITGIVPKFEVSQDSLIVRITSR